MFGADPCCVNYLGVRIYYSSCLCYQFLVNAKLFKCFIVLYLFIRWSSKGVDCIKSVVCNRHTCNLRLMCFATYCKANNCLLFFLNGLIVTLIFSYNTVIQISMIQTSRCWLNFFKVNSEDKLSRTANIRHGRNVYNIGRH